MMAISISGSQAGNWQRTSRNQHDGCGMSMACFDPRASMMGLQMMGGLQVENPTSLGMKVLDASSEQ